MEIVVRKGFVEGVSTAPPSKSYTHRALFCSSLAHGKSRIGFPLWSRDTEASKTALEKLGVEIDMKPNLWLVDSQGFVDSSSEIFCQESGTTLRFATAVSSLVNGETMLTGEPSLLKRPIEPLIECLRQLGVECTSNDGYPPIIVKGKRRITGGNVSIRGDVSSQFISAILLIAPYADEPLTLKLKTPLESKPYVSMTVETQRRFGVNVYADKDLRSFEIERQSYKPSRFTVEGDWSSSAYLMAAGALAGRVTVKGLKINSIQADRKILEILKAMGAETKETSEGITVEQSHIEGIEADLSDCPDLFPVVAALCSVAKGVSVLKGLGRLRFKESDRLTVMTDGLRRTGVSINTKNGVVEIKGGMVHGCIVNPENDHRIAMAFAVLGLVAEGETRILNSECVDKSFPEFWNVLESLNANIRRLRNEQ